VTHLAQDHLIRSASSCRGYDCAVRWLLGLIALGACTDSPPAPIPPDLAQVSASVTVTSRYETALEVKATFSSEVPLPSTARVSATFRNTSFELGTMPTMFGGLQHVGSTSFASPIIEGEAVSVTVEHDGKIATATVTMPAPFSVVSVTGALCQPPGQLRSTIEIMWSPTSTDAMSWRARAQQLVNHTSCTVAGTSYGYVEDTGTLMLTECVQLMGSFCGGLELALYRSRTGVTDGFRVVEPSNVRAEAVRRFY
jgi:hypothetical protein